MRSALTFFPPLDKMPPLMPIVDQIPPPPLSHKPQFPPPRAKILECSPRTLPERQDVSSPLIIRGRREPEISLVFEAAFLRSNSTKFTEAELVFPPPFFAELFPRPRSPLLYRKVLPSTSSSAEGLFPFFTSRGALVVLELEMRFGDTPFPHSPTLQINILIGSA